MYSNNDRAKGTQITWPTFQPWRPSFNYIGISDAYELCKLISNSKAQDNPYELTNVDSHLIKNSEWGAVAYLSHSKYGVGQSGKVAINSANAGGSDGGVWAVTGYGDIGAGGAVSMNLENLVTAHNAGKAWNTTEGDDASTNGNVSGVYDMSGGVTEWTTGYFTKSTGGNFGLYGGKLKDENNANSSKYKSKYEGIRTSEETYNNVTNKKRKGEALWETSTYTEENGKNWSGEKVIFVGETSPFQTRGGTCERGSAAGMFAYSCNDGRCSWGIGFRPVLVNN